ncbi:hypothetical protein JD276_08440 [Leucobacter sp. CSA1]|uniref:Uncharacterized protein n=1 Tax=Leucobacter chromiisoli TaxID=2796471 RepID=A0A934Q7D6_9MICO|nr:hypothetical protein [Leucobacter chromiisoli]MBK0419063.1 hypothetical protein [Leucobacter chromiisoli]
MRTRVWLIVQFLAFGLLIEPLLPTGPAQFLQVLLFALIGALVLASATPLLVRLLSHLLGIAPGAPPRFVRAAPIPLFLRPCAAGSRGTVRVRAPSASARPLG